LLGCVGVAVTGYRCAGEYLLAKHTHDANCIILDMCMPGPSGLELLDALAARPSAPPVIFITGFGDVPTSVHALKSGAVDFLTKPVAKERLFTSLHKALSLDAERRATREELEMLRERYVQLTTYERDVFAGIVNGKLNKQLAVTLGICERSIKSYRSRVMRKMRVSSLAGLVRTAKMLGVAQLNSPPPSHSMRAFGR